MVLKSDACGPEPQLVFEEMEPSEVIARLEPLEPAELLDYFAASRRERADVIQRYYSSPGNREVAENLIELEIDDHTRSIVISLLRQRQQNVVGL